MTAAEAWPNLAEELRRRRSALGWTLEQVAEQAQVSVGMLSLIETGKRRPSIRSWQRIRQTLGITEPLPEEAWREPPREITDELVATLGACLPQLRPGGRLRPGGPPNTSKRTPLGGPHRRLRPFLGGA